MAATPIGFRIWAGAAVLLALVGAAFELSSRSGWSLPHSFGVLFLAALALWTGIRLLGLDRRGRRRRRLLGVAGPELDRLDGAAFEEWVAAVLRDSGWRVVRTRPGSDYGVDLVAEKDGRRVGIEAKRRSARIPNAVVRSVVAGCQFHACTEAAVVTQSTFTRQSLRQAAAASIPVTLIDRHSLDRLRTF